MIASNWPNETPDDDIERRTLITAGMLTEQLCHLAFNLARLESLELENHHAYSYVFMNCVAGLHDDGIDIGKMADDLLQIQQKLKMASVFLKGQH